MTFRAHTERLTADDIPVYLGLDVAMGHFIDGAVSQWDEMFLPEKLQESLRRATIPTASGDTPLVVAETVLLSANRAPLRTTPPSRTVPMAVVGVLIGGLLAVLGRLGTRHRPARVAFGVLVAALAFVIGALGCVLVLLWAGTDHEVAYRNENVLQCAPWALLLGIAATRLAVKREGGERAAWAAALLALAFSALGLVLKALPPFHQVNGHIIALVLPLWVGTAAGCLAFVRRTPVTGIRAPERKPDVE
ncbi:MAG TPA: hypothetical protein VM925_12230 [Labilithrix sp.]|nr:hypothetical protein [Labilithrix sp.]